MSIYSNETSRNFFFFYTARDANNNSRENTIKCTLAAVESISGRILQVNTYKLNIHFSRKFLNKYLL